MKALIFFVFLHFLSAEEIESVTSIDIQKFSGLWYEVARTYNKFEKNCVAPTVEYVLKDNNKYRVHNRCFDKVMDGEMIEYHGTATPTNEGSTFTMDITYYFIFTKEYRLLHLEEDYSAAVMADQNLEHLWIMSREPTMKKNILDKILAKLDLQIDLKRLIYSSENKKGA
ncbi:MAG: hypothetical protein RL113_511 [Pseudomonadota bacterium]